ncbi:MAG: site-2 protease family protein [Candidatus Palauibacterales bacterium]|jgi:Zn-dependent protease/CBS domain-containing protein|nr:site-2 protease family protein [Candidatus Palauibacterales bacterium]MDP2482829.1 site-2 protease family protein [Candidatus Palauibacterales bacterium]
MRLGGFGAGRLLGFRIRIDYSWFFVLILVTWTFASWQFPEDLPGRSRFVYLAMGLSGALLLFVSVLLHELAHSVVARSRGILVEGITLFIFGGVAEMKKEPERALDEFVLTIVGPLSSLALSGAFVILARLFDAAGQAPAAVVAGTLAMLNLVLAVFNMVPAFPLDGGRVLRAVLWKLTGDPYRATRWATWVGRAFGWLLIMFGVYEFALGAQFAGVWSMFLGWFLAGAATSAARQNELKRALQGLTAGDLVSGPTVFVPEDLSAEDLVERFFLRHPATAFPVIRGRSLVGLVTVSDVSGLSLDARMSTRLAEIMRPIEQVPAIDSDRPLVEVVLAVQTGKHDRLMVVRDGEILGALTADDILGRVSGSARPADSGAS